MFQCAFALALDERYGDAVLDLAWITASPAHNGYELGHLFDVGLPECDEASRRKLAAIDPGAFGRLRRRLGLVPRSFVIARKNDFDADYLERAQDSYFSGYWQNPRYFEGIADRVRAAFSFKPPLSVQSERFLAGSPTPGVTIPTSPLPTG
jgi:hypothetical protein